MCLTTVTSCAVVLAGERLADALDYDLQDFRMADKISTKGWCLSYVANQPLST